jgi:hypothetical protein
LIGLGGDVATYRASWKDLGVYATGMPSRLPTAEPAFLTTPVARPMRVIDLATHIAGQTYGFMNRTSVDCAYRRARVAEFGTEGGPDAMVEQLSILPLKFLQGREGGGIKLRDDAANSTYAAPSNLASGGGGLVSTAHDYMRFCRMMLHGGTLDGVRILSPKTVALFSLNHLSDNRELADMAPPGLFSEAGYSGIGLSIGCSVNIDIAKTRLPVRYHDRYEEARVRLAARRHEGKLRRRLHIRDGLSRHRARSACCSAARTTASSS